MIHKSKGYISKDNGQSGKKNKSKLTSTSTRNGNDIHYKY